MFNSLLREFDEDPFFSDPFQAHNERMRQMMRSFSEPFGGNFMPSLMDGRDRGRGVSGQQQHQQQQGSALALREEQRDMELRNPFSMFDNMMTGMRSRMEDVNRNFGNLSTDPHCHSFSSSSVMTYSKNGDEPPKVFQASSQTRRAPGGIQETRRALRDSESGLEKMSIGHHIQDRGHVIEKNNNKKTGERELKQDFQNLDESEAQSFDEEWQREVSMFQTDAPMSALEGPVPKPRAAHRAAITPGTRVQPPQPHRERPMRGAEDKIKIHFKDSPTVSGSGMTRH
ncbi:myeloid leukemia factor 1 [Aplochiton taeniatus]